MRKLSDVELARLIVRAGAAEQSNYVLALAVLLAESGGDADAVHVNRNDNGIDRGLFQINSKYHPEVSDAVAFDPAQNVAAAWRISRGFSDFRQWATFPDACVKFFTRAHDAIRQALAECHG